MDNRKADRRINTLHPEEQVSVESDDSMTCWLHEMTQSDAEMLRGQEDFLSHLIEDHGYGEKIHPTLMAKWIKKKKLRSSK